MLMVVEGVVAKQDSGSCSGGVDTPEVCWLTAVLAPACLDLWVGEPEQLSREELLALLSAKDEQFEELLAAVVASDAAKDARIDALLVMVGDLTAQVQALVLKLSKDSATSSNPPSSDGPDRRPRGGSSRARSGRKPG